MKSETSGQTAETVKDFGYNTTNPKETLEEVEKIEDNGGVESGSKAIDNVIPNVEGATINPKKLTEYALN